MIVHSPRSEQSLRRSSVFQVPEAAQKNVRQHCEMALSGLPQMLDPDRHLFCATLRQTDHGLMREGISYRYSAIVLMGLHRLEQSGMISPVSITSVFNELLSDMSWIDNIGDLGLFLWLCTMVAPELVPKVVKDLQVEQAFERFRDSRHVPTMELAWFLTALSCATLSGQGLMGSNREHAFKAYELLVQNQGQHGIFSHLGGKRSFAQTFRSRIASFADQVYPIYSLTKFYEAFGHAEALKQAEACAFAICSAQGTFGQWWWHYDARTGRVVQGYPVFSVHQHGMAPMALFALGDASRSNFDAWIYKGLRWIDSGNELAFDMEDVSANVIWRSMYRSPMKRYLKTALGIFGRRHSPESADGLTVRFECRPYELGWLLYAFADRALSAV